MTYASAAVGPPPPGDRGKAWAAGPAGFALVVAAAVPLLGFLPASLADQRDYAAASACPAGRADADCRAESPATDVRTKTARGPPGCSTA
ncbi:hypothetical protein [Streptomyces sp. NPDC059970]|uniref:hypothetical protein n=1 Tax=Streptomyces sp. NPDC059970 TaxID=3347019 RepID=UPI0036A8B075